MKDLFFEENKEIKQKIKKGLSKKEICEECKIRIGNVRFCFKCAAKEMEK